jgi:hypothetical protein
MPPCSVTHAEQAILSTGLFDFQNDDLVVSKYWWVYVFFAAALTALVGLGWSVTNPVRRGWLRNVRKGRMAYRAVTT